MDAKHTEKIRTCYYQKEQAIFYLRKYCHNNLSLTFLLTVNSYAS